MTLQTGLGAQLGIAEEVYTNAQQTVSITGTPTGGTFTLIFEGAETAAIAYNSTAAQVKGALVLLPNIGVGDLGQSGGALPGTPVQINFSGGPVAGRPVGLLALGQNNLTGGSSPTVSVANTTPGTGYGSPSTVARFLEFTDESLALDIEQIESSALRQGNQVLRADRFGLNRKGAGGDMNFEVAGNGFGLLFKHMLGGAAPVITTPAGGTATRKHVYSMADPLGTSTTWQVGRPSILGVCQPFAYKGCKVTSWEISSAIDAMLMLKVTLDAQDEDETISLASVSYPASQALLYFTGAQLQIGGANVDVISYDLQFDAGLKTDRYYHRSSGLKKEPVRNALAAITGSVTCDWTDPTLYARFTSGATAAIVGTWTGPLIEGALYQQVVISLPVCRFDGKTPNVSGPDLLTEEVDFKALQPTDGTTSPITITYYTTDTTA